MIMSQKSIKVNLVMNMIVTILNVIFPLITFPYVSRVLGPTGTGAVSYAASIVSYFSIFALLGVQTYGIKACAEVRGDKDALTKRVQEIMVLLLCSTMLSYFALFVVIKRGMIHAFYEHIVYIYAVGIILQVIGMEWLYKALEEYRYIAVRSIMIKTVSIVLMFFLIREKQDYPMYAVINVFADGGAQILNFLFSFKHIKIKRYQDYHFKVHTGPLMIFFLTNVVHLVYTNLDIIMLEHMKGTYQVGIYNMALRIENILLSMVTALGVVVLPQLSVAIKEKRYDDFQKLNKKALNYTVAIALFFIAIFEIVAPECVNILGGTEYEESTLLFRILLFTLIMAGAANISGLQILIPLGKEKQFLLSVAGGALVDFVMNLIFIERLGNKATAFSTVTAELVVLLLQLWFMKRNGIPMPRLSVKPLFLVVLCFLTVGFVKKIVPIPNPVFACIVFGTIYGLMWLVMANLIKEEITLEIQRTILNKLGARKKND